jgi:hypothetical protein
MNLSHMGPLPLGDRNDTQEQLSLKALRNRLPQDKFLVRDERIDDKGVDVVLEAKLEVRMPTKAGGEELMHSFTNCRAQAQLKSIDDPEPNQDGSVSCSIDTSNLNYLLNGQCPIYFLWLASADEIRYAWAKDEWRRLDAEKPDWMSQGAFTIRFQNVLDGAAVDSIHERIIREAQFSRRISETVARSATSEQVVVGINPQSLETSDPVRIRDLLMSSGMTFVAAGFGRQVLDLAALLNPADRSSPRVQMVCAYAHYTMGRYDQARGLAAEASLKTGALPALDRNFLATIRNASEHQTGRISLEEYVRREEDQANEDADAHVAHRLESLRFALIHEREPSQREPLIADLRRLVSDIQTNPAASDSFKLQARIVLLAAEGDELVVVLLHELVYARMRHGTQLPTGRRALDGARRMHQLLDQWRRQSDQAVQDAIGQSHPILIGDARAARVTVSCALLLQMQLNAISNEQPFSPPPEMFAGLISEAEAACDVYAAAGAFEGELRAKLLIADLLEFAGRTDEARALACEVIPQAQAMDYVHLTDRAQGHASGQTIAKDFERLYRERLAKDDTLALAEESDDKMRELARASIESHAIPLDRLPVVEREWLSLRDIAREQVNWCEQLEMTQDLRHTLSRSTLYVRDPARRCLCKKHGHESQIADPDWQTIIRAFKQVYCDGCPDRSPKEQPTS